MNMIDINQSRQIRARIRRAISFYGSDSNALIRKGNKLQWSDLENIPDWYMWNNEQKIYLSLVAGTVFLLPSIRLWIENKKIHTVQALIGKTAYDFIISNTININNKDILLDIEDIESALLQIGASVIISSQNKKYHPWLLPKFPQSNKTIERKAALEIVNHALFVITETTKFENKKQGE
jgi:hypothetical protein